MAITYEDPPGNEELNRIFTEACKAQNEGQLSIAAEKYLLLLDSFPQAAMLHYNLGLVYFSLELFTKAIDEFSTALLLQPDDCDTLFNLALCQQKTGDCEEAINTYGKLLAVTPESTDCYYNLAGCYRDILADERAIDCYQKVLALDADYLPALNNLAYLHHRNGNLPQAELLYRQLTIRRPDDEAAGYMLSALQGIPLSHAPDAYVRRLFDSYSSEFEKNLIEDLGYDTPRQLYRCLVRHLGGKRNMNIYERGLDLGCGTGLSGEAFQDRVAIFHGVDLSAKMLQMAQNKNCYTTLVHDNIDHYLHTTAETYDFFLATDVFIYVGALQEIFSALKALTLPKALFCFSTEHLESDGYRLLQTGRFAYSRSYILKTAAMTGWTVLASETTRIRKEREQWITGDLWVLHAI